MLYFPKCTKCRWSPAKPSRGINIINIEDLYHRLRRAQMPMSLLHLHEAQVSVAAHVYPPDRCHRHRKLVSPVEASNLVRWFPALRFPDHPLAGQSNQHRDQQISKLRRPFLSFVDQVHITRMEVQDHGKDTCRRLDPDQPNHSDPSMHLPLLVSAISPAVARHRQAVKDQKTTRRPCHPSKRRKQRL